MTLKPCPFCGSEAKAEPFEEEGLSKNFNPSRVICKNYSCNASIEVIKLKDSKNNLTEAVERWNKRSK
jgi:Lar family restriction alleviation protein